MKLRKQYVLPISSDNHPNGFVATDTLGHMMYKLLVPLNRESAKQPKQGAKISKYLLKKEKSERNKV